MMGCAPTAGALLIVIVAVALGCSATWERRDDSCVRELADDGEQRVINYADPELCDRPVRERRPDHVRTPVPEEE